MIKVADKVEMSIAARRALPTPAQFHVTRQYGTERAGTSALDWEKRAGTYACVCCGQRLVSSTAWFESGTGWPSLHRSEAEDAVHEHDDRSLFMRRTDGVALTFKPGDP
jgi:peptide-methionine (R)-S-oxide reductase